MNNSEKDPGSNENSPDIIKSLQDELVAKRVLWKEAEIEFEKLGQEAKFLLNRLEAAKKKVEDLSKEESVATYDLVKASGDKYNENVREVNRRVKTERPDLFSEKGEK